MLVKDVCTLDVATCGRELNVLEAAYLMRQHHTGDLIVVDDPEGDRTPAGIITDRDIVIEVLAQDLDPARTSVSTVMNSKLVMAGASEDVVDAVERMRMHGVRRLPVVAHDGGLYGILTLDDILTLQAGQFSTLAGVVAKEQTREIRSRR